ncbi:CDP-diacylglycerol--glycerol-3-phosphate 3-phosphatidyltransferase [Persicirhabdus sediminis]|uniref:CDP-diacylglycerol--glycerol-3-phosphate 3-phosphatidyltransferase n=1 Tax=Persicirhabdus sediminis TaxID=454144 RepID=A0A8J7SKV4_9BACT|nr:CDP-diacylglycerol--glycerol-3-phosphate 3-phosphatidyltransferase [Persicirhabdus sediminis]MBK1790008.1 CDP-diacylglycerol--glycerol-3-phosphate 3-phosphatidyltransferase [Persicirhabdus sediminis]
MNLPNTITLLRLVLTAIFCLAASYPGKIGYAIALITFVIAAISDFFDGYLARKLNLVTSMGKLLDPLADKILVCAGFVFLTAANLCPAWITALILCREFLVTGIRQIAVEKGTVIAADKLGKWKTTFQLTYVITLLVHLMLREYSEFNWFFGFFNWLSQPTNFLVPTSLWLAVIFTVYSGYSYFWNARDMIFDRDQ